MARRVTISDEDRGDKIIDAALRLAAARPWSGIDIGAIAEEAGLPLVEVHRLYAGKSAILAGFGRRIDAEALAGTVDAADPAHDRLFEVLMRRFEALKPYREAIRFLVRPGPALLPLALHLPCSMGWMLAAAHLSAPGLRGLARAKILGATWLSVLPVFLRDEGEDLAKTMAALDKALRRAGPFLGLGRRQGPEKAAVPA